MAPPSKQSILNKTVFKQYQLSLVGLVLGALVSSVSHAQTITDIGTLGGTNASAYGVSANGSVIVGFSTTVGDSAAHAFEYVGGTMIDIGSSGSDSFAVGISSDGLTVVGGASNHAFKYYGGTMTDLGTLGGTYSTAYAASADGSIIVGTAALAGDSAFHAFKYSGGVMHDIGTLGGSSATAFGVSADGSVIVGSSTLSSGLTRAFKYSGGTMQDIGTLGGLLSSASAISADGSVIVGNSTLPGDSTFLAFKYSNGTMTSLGALSGGNSFATAVSASGSVIVGYASDNAGLMHAFKYTNNSMTDLGTLGGNTFATAVSSNGKVIVGYTSVSGVNHAWVYNNSSDSDSGSSGGGGSGGGTLVDVNNTYSALATNSYQLNSLLNAQNTALTINLNSDCTVYGANDICVGMGGRYTNVNNPTTAQTAGNVQLGYRMGSSFRVGAFLDQGISSATPNNYTVKNSQPLAGLFAVYAPSGNQLGIQVRASGAYGSNGVNITRTTLANTEAGQGSSTMTTMGGQLESAYGFEIGEGNLVSPFVGIKSTLVSRNSYTETAGATFPITYNTVNQSATTTYVGAKAFAYVAPKISLGISAGVEQDLSSNISNYSGSIYYLGSFSYDAPSIQKTRSFASANADYWIEKNQRLSLGAYYNQQSLNTSNGITAMLSYTVGL